MKTWDVTIVGKVRKVERVEAKTQEEAIEQAHEQFDISNTGDEESYEETWEHCEEVLD